MYDGLGVQDGHRWLKWRLGTFWRLRQKWVKLRGFGWAVLGTGTWNIPGSKILLFGGMYGGLGVQMGPRMVKDDWNRGWGHSQGELKQKRV